MMPLIQQADRPEVVRVTRPTIGVLLSNYDGPYHAAVLRGLQRAAAELDVHLLCMAGNLLGTEGGYQREFNLLYHLAPRLRLDGLLSLTDSFRGSVAQDQLEAFFRQFGAVPIVGLSGGVPGMPVVKPDNRSGMAELVDHFIRDLGFRRIAFIGGPDDNSDAMERLATFRACHAAAGLAVDPALVLPGRFSRLDGRTAVRTLLAAGTLPEAIIAANDEMAIEAMRTLQEHGVRVPDDVAVAGFDDLASQIDDAPPLTSVRQETTSQAQFALRLLVRHLQGETIPAHTEFPSRLLRRRSCGCAGADAVAGAAASWEHPDLAEQECASLRRALQADLGGEGGFAVAFADSARRYRDRGLLSHDLRQMLMQLHRESSATPATAALLFEAQSWLVDNDRLQISGHLLERIYPSWLMASVLRRSLSGPDFALGNILVSLRAGLLSLGASNAYLVLYESVARLHRWDDCELQAQAQLVLAIRDGKALIASDFERFPVDQLLPMPVFHETGGAMYAVLPLFRQNEHHGLLILDIDHAYSLPLEQLREAVSNLITGSIVMGELDRTRELLRQDLHRAQTSNQQLAALSEHDELTGLLNRRGFLNGAEALVMHGAKPLLLMSGDMDGLKAINDNFGHQAGDAAIIAMADVLRGSFRERDLIARLGGDEFVVLSEHLPHEAQAHIRTRIERRVADFNAAPGQAWKIAISLGFMPAPVGDATKLGALLAAADALLYEDKRRRKAAAAAGEG